MDKGLPSHGKERVLFFSKKSLWCYFIRRRKELVDGGVLMFQTIGSRSLFRIGHQCFDFQSVDPSCTTMRNVYTWPLITSSQMFHRLINCGIKNPKVLICLNDGYKIMMVMSTYPSLITDNFYVSKESFVFCWELLKNHAKLFRIENCNWRYHGF